MRQLLLNILLRDEATFDNFYAGRNQSVLDYLKNPAESFLYVYSKSHSGLTHILQALCKSQKSCLYIPFEQLSEFTPEILENLFELELIIIDDIEKIAGQYVWENKIFDLYNQLLQHQKKLIVSSHVLPQQLNINLNDLKSRLQSMLLLTLEELNDEEKIAALQKRAQHRGLQLSDEVAQFLIHRVPRDMAKLFEILRHLDRHSLEANRRLTIPFIKKVLYTEPFV
ncbi:MAG: DnaA regulatory inactivator Hda [Gammaproteobacteria bacterium]|nr:DnaA regulatory inactivator Hda [Gammaproteobacteria bacterium]